MNKQFNYYKIFIKTMRRFQNLFLQIVKTTGQKEIYQKIMKEAKEKYNLIPFKISKLNPSSARKIYTEINSKYDKGQFQLVPRQWQENQRRLFIWFAIIYQYYCKSSLLNITAQEWKKLSKIFHGKDQIFLEYQYRNILKIKERLKWTKQEDQYLTEGVQIQQQGRWNEVSKYIFFKSQKQIFKSPKHCRERWFNYLDPSKTKQNWTFQEDRNMLQFILKNGKSWSKIVKQLDNKRTQHMIKNRFNSLISKQRRQKHEQQQVTIKNIINQINKQQPLPQQNCKKQQIKKQKIEAENLENLPIQVKNILQTVGCNSSNTSRQFLLSSIKSPYPLISPLPSLNNLTPHTFFKEDKNFNDYLHYWNKNVSNNEDPLAKSQILQYNKHVIKKTSCQIDPTYPKK